MLSLNKEDSLNTKDISNPYIKKAFDKHGFTMLTIQEFIKASSFPIDSFMIDTFFHSLDTDTPIYVTNELIDWCGFQAKELRQRKYELNRMLKTFEEGVDYWTYSNDGYAAYYEKSIVGRVENTTCYPHPDTFVKKNKTKHLVLTVSCFKQVLMMLTTKKAHEVRLYFLSLEELVKVYIKYQLYYQKYQNQLLTIVNADVRRELCISNEKYEAINEKYEAIVTQNDSLLKKCDELLLYNEDMKESLEVATETLVEMNQKLGVATDERAPKTKAVSKHDAVMIVKINNLSRWPYYIIRIQRGSLKRTLKSVKLRYPNCEELTTIPYQPNGVNFFNLMKENLPIVTYHNSIKLKDGYTERTFLQDICDLDMSKRDVDVSSDEKEE